VNTCAKHQQDAVGDVEPVLVEGGASQQPALITENEVRFGTAAHVGLPPVTIIRHTLISVSRVVRAALRPPAPRPAYSHRYSYIERAAMSREMDRL
jgi:hypothetical protein